MSTYQPAPIDTSGISLPPGLEPLTEQLAKNTHDIWARERIAQGWKPGPRRNDETKEHPGLIPYDELSESEKRFDRQTALETIKLVLALGYRVEPGSPAWLPGPIQAVAMWRKHLEEAAASAENKGPRAWTFDMDDQPELDALKADLPLARGVLQELQRQIHDRWAHEDALALKRQRLHTRIAAFAIWPGVIAIVLAILQLAAPHLADGHSGEVLTRLENLELAAIFVALIAVSFGHWHNVHHSWLEHRQRAERLRILKFSALSWPELWCDFDKWKERLDREVRHLNRISKEEAMKWACENDPVDPTLPEAPSCPVPQADFQVLALHYQIKRLRFQHHYFSVQAVKAQRSSWMADWKLGIKLLVLSGSAVILHSVLHFLSHSPKIAHYLPWHDQIGRNGLNTLDVLLITTAALLPVIGFGLRAWQAAFEAPRSRNLYRAKALALQEYLKHIQTEGTSVEHTLHQISLGEHFFTNEHREWFRLQMEAEWFA